ncbi:hypothetical protein NQD34_007282 [Periophthalmus magnuspinnatus]|nr:hypothetical protein NQD34_007282 [Periophthalmus magnuspinnatus]
MFSRRRRQLLKVHCVTCHACLHGDVIYVCSQYGIRQAKDATKPSYRSHLWRGIPTCNKNAFSKAFLAIYKPILLEYLRRRRSLMPQCDEFQGKATKSPWRQACTRDPPPQKSDSALENNLCEWISVLKHSRNV